ncbi:hypothetical protein [Rhizobium rhizogenes]|uniref:Uncharacterized protein n=1 Tax=Rhizobium rhizogenes TaxID=359 RepID=A0AA92C396_RHIRH|nr:hypothetical protein [Rhizobium rhizogenes]PVE54009.1 hypothetical protein DC430_12210 [Rhizobium rhizogenes]PVE66500.1 hypothetical protein DC415_08825 [Agrobacterium tumefaciens]PVE76488.1 hypothetical protein DCP16_08825 [Sphingomonas sp. TPD3009]
MKSVLGGALEYSVIRRMTEEFKPDVLKTSHPYYRSLQRSVPENSFSRAATILAISDNARLPAVDWSSGMLGDAAPSTDNLGWTAFQGSGMWEPLWTEFVKRAIDAKAFTQDIHQHLTAVDPIAGQTDDSEQLQDFAVHHLMRLLLQVEASNGGDIRLFLPQKDEQALMQLSEFAATCSEGVPVYLPDFQTVRNDPEGRSVTLLAFDPPDVLSLIPAREDSAVRKYAEQVSGLWEIADPIERERNAVHAMREVVKADQVRSRAARAFEAVAWGLKPLSWLGVPLVGAISDTRDVAAVAANRERTARNWLLIRTRMQDISLHDYLKRTENM